MWKEPVQRPRKGRKQHRTKTSFRMAKKCVCGSGIGKIQRCFLKTIEFNRARQNNFNEEQYVMWGLFRRAWVINKW